MILILSHQLNCLNVFLTNLNFKSAFILHTFIIRVDSKLAFNNFFMKKNSSRLLLMTIFPFYLIKIQIFLFHFTFIILTVKSFYCNEPYDRLTDFCFCQKLSHLLLELVPISCFTLGSGLRKFTPNNPPYLNDCSLHFY